MSKIKTNSIESFSENDLKINTKTNILSNENSTSSSTGSLVLNGGLGIDKDLQIDGSINVNLTTNSTEKDMGSLIVKGGISVEKNIYLGGDLITEGFLNINRNSKNITLIETTDTAVTGDFTNSDILFISLNGSSSSTSIRLSIQNPTPNKIREIQLYVKSNGNYSFNSTTIEGLPILWKTTTNTDGTQPTWSDFNTLTDFHNFLYDGSRLFHVQTFTYHTPTITPPTILNYQTNSFDLYPYISYTFSPTFDGTQPLTFSNPTNDLPSGIKLTSSGSLEIYRTSTLNTVTPTIQVKNSNNFVNRQVNIRISHAFGTMTKGFSGNTSGYELSSIGSISSSNFYSNDISSIQILKWNYISSGPEFGYWFYFSLSGNMININWNTIEIETTSFLKSNIYSVNFNETTNRTNWIWWSNYNNEMNLNKYNDLQNYSNPINFRIY